MCKIRYPHDFPDYPCKKCNGNKWYWLKLKTFFVYGLGSEIVKFILLLALLAFLASLLW